MCVGGGGRGYGKGIRTSGVGLRVCVCGGGGVRYQGKRTRGVG